MMQAWQGSPVEVIADHSAGDTACGACAGWDVTASVRWQCESLAPTGFAPIKAEIVTAITTNRLRALSTMA